jgi:hypothetical protein
MKTLWMLVLSVFFCIPFTVQAQVLKAKSRILAPPPPDLGPEPNIFLTSAEASNSGLKLVVQAARVGVIGVQIERQDNMTGSWVILVDGIEFPVPSNLKDAIEPVGSSFVAPLLLPGTDNSYRALVYGKVRADDPRDWKYSNALVLHGFDNVPKPITNSIQLEFSDQSLTISTETDEKVVLKASWHVGGHTGIGLQATSEMQNPKVDLSYGSLPKEPSGTFPAIDIALLDESGHTLQEAKVAVNVASTQAVKSRVTSVKDQPNDSKQSQNTKFSWSELAKTGLGALAKFFL